MTQTPALSTCPGCGPLMETPLFSTTSWSSQRTVRMCRYLNVSIPGCLLWFLRGKQLFASCLPGSDMHSNVLIYKRHTYGEQCSSINSQVAAELLFSSLSISLLLSFSSESRSLSTTDVLTACWLSSK